MQLLKTHSATKDLVLLSIFHMLKWFCLLPATLHACCMQQSFTNRLNPNIWDSTYGLSRIVVAYQLVPWIFLQAREP